MKKVFLLVLMTAGSVFGQQLVKADQGAPGNQGPWPVKVVGPINVIVGGSDGGATAVVGVDGGPVPVSQASFPWKVSGADGGPVQVSGSVTVVGPDGGAVQVSVSGPVVVQGADGGPVQVSGSVTVLGADGGSVAVTSTQATCNSPTHTTTSVGTSAVNCPGAQLAGRYSIVICNSLENPGAGSRVIKVRIDGVNPVIGAGNPGDVLGVGDCIPYFITSAIVPRCIASLANTQATGLECK